jgi:hypothetical protein
MVPWVLGFIGSISLEALAIVYSNVLRDHINQVRHYHYQNQEIKEQRKRMTFGSLTFSNLFIKKMSYISSIVNEMLYFTESNQQGVWLLSFQYLPNNLVDMANLYDADDLD